MVELSFEQFFRDQYASLVALGTALTGDRAAGEDLAQDALSITHRQWTEVSAYDRPGAFTRRTLINRASNERRRRSREQRAVRRLGASRRRAEVPAPSVADPLWSEVASLPHHQRAAITLRYLADLPVAEIAETLECAEATARVHLHRAHRRLAERLGDTHNDATPQEDTTP